MPRIALPVPPDIPNAAAEGRLLLFPDRRKPTTPTQRRVRAGLEGPATYETGIGRQKLQGQRQRERDKRQRESDRGNAFFYPIPILLFLSLESRSLLLRPCAAAPVLQQQSRSAIFLIRLDNTLSRCLQGLKGSQLIFTLLAALPLTTPRLCTQVVFRRFAVRRTGP